MRFGPTAEQRSFAEALDALLSAAHVPEAARAWAAGEHDPGLRHWHRLAELGVTGLLVSDERGGLGADEVDVSIAFQQLGRHAVPGPWIESVVLAPRLLAGTGVAETLERVATGEAMVSIAAQTAMPRALDADIAAEVFLLDGGVLRRGEIGRPLTSVDPTRRLFVVRPGEEVGSVSAQQAGLALDGAALAAAAMALGAGERLLEETVSYALSRRQFGHAIGEYQALKHLLADVRVALDFARPLLHQAALQLAVRAVDADRDVSAAKVACTEAAQLAARTALQVHGAIGYTLEFDLSLWILKARALLTAWGTPSHHRQRVLSALTRS
jgi:alkylation response protein AidB-like acyl-CoA dehydrogenase